MEKFSQNPTEIAGPTELLNREFEHRHIVEYHQLVQESYLKNFVTAGYEKIQPVDIASSYDKSTIFIGSSISTFKPMLEDYKIPECGAVVVQPCMRTQNKKNLYNDEVVPEYNSYFNIIGGIAPLNKTEDVCNHFTDYLRNDLNIDPSCLTIKINRDDMDLLQGVSNLGDIKIEMNTREPKYYRWIYGMEGISGRGLTYSVKNFNSGTNGDIGNIIIMDKGGKSVAVQWGFGVETILSRVFGKKYPIESSLIGQACFPKFETLIKFQDTLASVLEMFISKVKPGVHSAGCEQRDYLKGLSYLRRKFDITLEDVQECANKYLKLKGIIDQGAVEEMITYIVQHEKKVAQFSEIVLDLKKTSSTADVLKILENQAQRIAWTRQYHVNILEMKKIILSI